MDRRSVLTSLFGGLVVTVSGGALLASTTSARAAPAVPDLLDQMRAAAPAVATEDDLAEATADHVRWVRQCVRRSNGRVVCRSVWVGGRRRRRCFRDRFGRLICRYY
jgi:hypothetical protein